MIEPNTKQVICGFCGKEISNNINHWKICKKRLNLEEGMESDVESYKKGYDKGFIDGYSQGVKKVKEEGRSEQDGW